MIGLDTNILIRYITQDDPNQSLKATALIEHHLTEYNPGFISVVTLVEMVWVLTRTYSLTDDEIAAEIKLILSSDSLIVEHEKEAHGAMIALKEGRGKFADALVGALGLKAGCSHTLTFDKKASRLSGFELLS